MGWWPCDGCEGGCGTCEVTPVSFDLVLPVPNDLDVDGDCSGTIADLAGTYTLIPVDPPVTNHCDYFWQGTDPIGCGTYLRILLSQNLSDGNACLSLIFLDGSEVTINQWQDSCGLGEHFFPYGWTNTYTGASTPPYVDGACDEAYDFVLGTFPVAYFYPSPVGKTVFSYDGGEIFTLTPNMPP